MNHEGHREHEDCGLQDESLDAVLESGHIEVDQQPRLYAGELHISQQRCLLNSRKFVDALQFQNQLSLD